MSCTHFGRWRQICLEELTRIYNLDNKENALFEPNVESQQLSSSKLSSISHVSPPKPHLGHPAKPTADAPPGSFAWIEPGDGLNRRQQAEKGDFAGSHDDSEPVLVLQRVHTAPVLNFGTLHVGVKATKTLIISNPGEFEETLRLEKGCESPAFEAHLREVDLRVSGKSDIRIQIDCKPQHPGNCRDTISFRNAKGISFRAVFLATGVENIGTAKARK